MVMRHLRRDLDYLEIGASLGAIASVAGARLRPEARMICVEANPELHPLLQSTLRRSSHGREVIFVHAALDYGGKSECGFSIQAENTGGRVASGVAANPSPEARVVQVPAVTLGQLVAQLQLREYSLVCDIEGAEIGFIRSAREDLEGCRQLIIELHDVPDADGVATWQDLLDDLIVDHGFRVEDARGPVQVLSR